LKETAMPFQIVIAWTEDSAEWDGEPYAADLGERPTMRPVRLAKACMWLNRGTAADVEKARVYAAPQGYSVLTFPASVRDPLGAARAAVLRG
jgi:hypothetical protein